MRAAAGEEDEEVSRRRKELEEKAARLRCGIKAERRACQELQRQIEVTRKLREDVDGRTAERTGRAHAGAREEGCPQGGVQAEEGGAPGSEEEEDVRIGAGRRARVSRRAAKTCPIVRVHMCTRMCVRTYALCTYARMYVYTYVCVYVCLYVCVHVCCVYTRTYTYVCVLSAVICLCIWRLRIRKHSTRFHCFQPRVSSSPSWDISSGNDVWCTTRASQKAVRASALNATSSLKAWQDESDHDASLQTRSSVQSSEISIVTGLWPMCGEALMGPPAACLETASKEQPITPRDHAMCPGRMSFRLSNLVSKSLK